MGPAEAMNRAVLALDGAESWRGLLEDLTRVGLLDHLDAEHRQALGEMWQTRKVQTLSDRALADDLEHWSKGLGFNDHQDGFEAITPHILVEDARRRGWFVSITASGGAIVGLPDRKPVRLQLS